MGSNSDIFTSKEEYAAAVQALEHAALTYYDGAILVMDDNTYDVELAKVASTEAAHPSWKSSNLTSSVAGGVSAGGDIKHERPMLSLDKAHALEAITAWYTRLAKLVGDKSPPVIVEPKLDGMAISLKYIKGKLVRVVTRGDGQTGEDVTNQLRNPQNPHFPRTLKTQLTMEVRGEAVFTEDQYELANKARLATGAQPFVNRRNAVAGSIRRTNAASSPLVTFVAYDVCINGDTPFDSYGQGLEFLADLGFYTAAAVIGPIATLGGPEALSRAIIALGKQRSSLAVELDGAVVKLDDLKARSTAGATGSHPRWAIAFKYAAEERTTRLLGIEIEPGRTGLLVPRAVLEPVFVGGTTVSYATLHHPQMVVDMGLHIGDTVMVKRAGDVIPRIEGVLTNLRPPDATPWVAPTKCPRCNSDVDKSSKRWKCVRGRYCGAAELLAYFVSRDAMDIDGCGPKSLNLLIEAGLVTDAGDLYNLNVNDVLKLEGYAQTSAQALINNIAKSKTQPLSRLLTGLGIPGTGRTMCRRLAKEFKTLEAIRAATQDQLAAVEGIGERKAPQIFLELIELNELLDRLVAHGLTTTEGVSSSVPVTGSKPLAGEIVVVSGSVPGLSRTEAQEAVERLGGKVSSSVSAKTTLLVAGEGAGSKRAKAESLGIRIMDAQDYSVLVASS